VAEVVFKVAAPTSSSDAATFQGLETVGGLAKGRTAARETEPVGPVDDDTVDATLPHLIRPVRGLVESQRLTGCRPGEGCRVRRCDLDTGGAVWVFRPGRYKGQHRERARPRAVAVGPRALLKEFFTPDLGAYLFSPRRAVAEFRAARAAGRATPRYASHEARTAGKRVAAERYTPESDAHAVGRGCDRAFPPPGVLAQRAGETRAGWWGRLTAAQRAAVKEWRAAHRWQPNQLRHAFATRVRKGHGLEAAQVLLGHARADVPQVYAERNDDPAATIAAEIG
jgi:integrase